MGYYSEVGLVLYEDDYDALMKQAQPLLEKDYCSLLSQAPGYFIRHEVQYVYLHVEDVKWYQGFDEVDLIESFIKNVPHTYLIIGEEFGDVKIDYVNECDNDVFDYIITPKAIINDCIIKYYQKRYS